eukprot:UN27544
MSRNHFFLKLLKFLKAKSKKSTEMSRKRFTRSSSFSTTPGSPGTSITSMQSHQGKQGREGLILNRNRSKTALSSDLHTKYLSSLPPEAKGPSRPRSSTLNIDIIFPNPSRALNRFKTMPPRNSRVGEDEEVGGSVMPFYPADTQPQSAPVTPLMLDGASHYGRRSMSKESASGLARRSPSIVSNLSELSLNTDKEWKPHDPLAKSDRIFPYTS